MRAATGSMPSRPATLVVIHPSGTRSRVSLQPLPFNIGRQAENHLVIRDNRASRNHARIVTDGGEYFVEDLKSSHGVFVNGARVSRQKLFAADRIEFGFPDSYSCVFTFDEDEINKILDQLTASAAASSQGTGNLAKLRALVDVARALQNSLSTDDVLGAVVDAGLAITGAERGFLLLNRDGQLVVNVARDRNAGALTKDALDAPLEAIQRALVNRRELLSMNFDPHGSEFSSRTLGGEGVRRVICVPLVRVRAGSTEETYMITSKGDTVGLLYLDSKATAVDLSSGNRELLQTLALEASTILENARLLEEEQVKRRMEQELAIAREIQTSLLPRKLPSIGWFRAAGSTIPSHAVGGDCYDVRQMSPEVWSAMVMDVSGKGVSSALLAALVQGGFLTGGNGASDIAHTMERINRFLYERTQGEKYATVFYCEIHCDGTLRWSNAGHVKPLLVRSSGEAKGLESTGMPLGMLDTATFGVESVKLSPGDKIVAYSDGLTEAENAAGEFFDAARLQALVRKNAAKPASKLLNALMAEVENYTQSAVQSDDITALVIEYSPE